MPYLIDGHNLIPQIPGLSLEDVDDEDKLIQLLQDYARLAQTTVEVYFDHAAPGQTSSKQLGRVKAVFVSSHTIADERIIKRMKTLGKGVQNWKVVTTDRQIQAEARAVRAGLMDSNDFARQMVSALAKQPASVSEPPAMSPSDLAGWMKAFGVEENNQK